MDEEIIVRKVSDADVESLAHLYDEVWPDGSTDNLQKANFVLRESDGVSYCAERAGKLVGSRTSFFMPVYFGDRKINCVQFADSCVDKSCRRKGLFIKMNNAFLKELFEERGGELVYNISVNESRAAYEKLGWVYIQSLTGVRKYVRPFHILKQVGFDIRKIRGAVINNLETDIVGLDESLLASREKLLSDKIHVRYDSDTFAWRMKSGNGIRVLPIDDLGAVVYKIGYKPCGMKVITMGEIFLYEYNRKNLKKIERALFKKEKPDMVLCMLTIGHPLLKLYKRIGYFGGKGFSNHGVKVMSEEMKSICYNPTNWGMAFIDIDTF